uniref:Dynein_attach_N domain-containing protein n=1 Tax=Parastrongyloides trichosuri TaxID=131310 RepID=A0A0N4ZTF9_PARTI
MKLDKTVENEEHVAENGTICDEGEEQPNKDKELVEESKDDNNNNNLNQDEGVKEINDTGDSVKEEEQVESQDTKLQAKLMKNISKKFSKMYSEKAINKMLTKIKNRDIARQKMHKEMGTNSTNISESFLNTGDLFITPENLKIIHALEKNKMKAEDYDFRMEYNAEEVVKLINKDKQFQAIVWEARKKYPYAYMSIHEEMKKNHTFKLNINNKSNQGFIFDKRGVPFWMNKKNLKSCEESPTDDSLPLDASIINDVYDGKVKLKKCTKKPRLVERWDKIGLMTLRDSTYFDDYMIFSNTIRSMIKVIDPDENSSNKKEESISDRKKNIKSPSKTNKKSLDPKVKFGTLPETVVQYDRLMFGEYIIKEYKCSKNIVKTQ